jgi:hypothetical protein
MTFRKGEILLLDVSLIGERREVVLSLNILKFGSISRRIESIKLAESAGDGSVVISGVDLNFFFIKFGVEEVESLNVLFVEGFTEVLVLSHSHWSEFTPDVVGRVAVVNRVQVSSGSVPEQTDHLVKFCRTNNNQQKQKTNSEEHIKN